MTREKYERLQTILSEYVDLDGYLNALDRFARALHSKDIDYINISAYTLDCDREIFTLQPYMLDDFKAFLGVIRQSILDKMDELEV